MKTWLVFVSIAVALSIGGYALSTHWASPSTLNGKIQAYPDSHNTGKAYDAMSKQNAASKTLRQLVSPIPTQPNIDKEKAKIGWLLFKDPNLSSSGGVSCESCHDLRSNGAETTEVSVGVNGQGSRNSLTVFNVGFNYRFFWDGRANSLADQLDGPVHNVLEMDTNWSEITRYVRSSKRYPNMFGHVDLDINERNIKAVLVEFMLGLTTPSSPFDQYLLGNQSALNERQKRGWESFQHEGCINCHRGVNIGGGMVMRFGYFGENKIGENRTNDTGKHSSTQNTKDMYLFRVASLRNVAETAPYFHDGKTHSLREAIQIMAESQLGKTFDQQTTDDIYAFLTTLSGKRPSILEEFSNDSNR
ncbi:cytochrome-c peroxidase [Vibrio marisflavi]|uniref:cytochrome-c peroxidase n=1 Tax=Vibrio marisflavi TaxID=1216040 RepID=UPI001F029672|nr:cytochrome c peroxidase [Vibrio marisflavi]